MSSILRDSNGQVQKSAVSLRSTLSHHLMRTEKSTKDMLPAIETKNWLLHKHYIRHEYQICKIFIEDELQQSNGYNEYANYLKGIILRKEGRVQEALECFKKCCVINSANPNNVKQVAKSLALLGNHEGAIELFFEAEKLSEKPEWEIYYNIGECYLKLNRLSDAITHLTKAIELTKNQEPYLTLAKIYVSQNKISEALNVYTAALKHTPENEDVSIELGMLYIKLGNYKYAFQQFGSALATFPNCARPIIPMTFLMQNNQEFDVALSKYKIASKSMPESWILWNNVGMCFYGKQKFVAAISCLKRAHYLNPLAMSPACNLGIVLLTTGQPASAAIFLSSAVSLSANAVLPHLLYGLALKKLNDVEGAEASFSRALSLAPQDPLVLINYAIFLEAEGRYEKANEILSILNDASAIIDIDAQITETAKKLSIILKEKDHKSEEPSQLASDEV